MSQRDTLRAADAAIHAALAAAGAASTATYTPPGGGAPVSDIRVYLEEDGLAESGEFATVANPVKLVGFLLADCTPARGGTVEIEGETYRLDSLQSKDASIATWAVTNA